MTADGLYESRMQELAESVEDLGQSSSVPFDWNLDMYNLNSSVSAGLGGGAPDLPPAGMETSTTTGDGGEAVQGQSSSATPASRAGPVFNVEVGEFVALPTPPNTKESVIVGKVLSIEEGDGDDEVELHWYIPARVISDGDRSTYGRGRWVPEFVREHGRLVPSVGTESVAAISSKFLSLTSQGKLPSHVWASVAESTAPFEKEGGDEEGEKDRETNEGSLAQEDDGGGEGEEEKEEGTLAQEELRGAGQAEQGGGGITDSDVVQELGLPENASAALVALARAMPPSNVRITAAFHRPRRSTAGQSRES